MAKTEAGFWLAIEPVEVKKVETIEQLRLELLAALSRDNPVVPTPPREAHSHPVMARHCGLKSYSAFERTASFWSITRKHAATRITEWSDSHRGGRTAMNETILPEGCSLADVALRAAELALSASVADGGR